MKRSFLKIILAICAAILLCMAGIRYQYGVSEQDTVSFWYPKWACGDCPDMLVIAVENPANARYAAKHSYLFVGGRFWHEHERYMNLFDDNEYKLVCTGRFKTSFKMKMYEAESALWPFGASGLFFDSEACEPAPLTDDDRLRIQSVLDAGML